MDGREERVAADLRSSARRARRRLLLALLGVALAVGTVLLVGRAAGYRTMVDDLRGAAPEWLLVALLAETGSFAGYIWALRSIVRADGGPHLSLGDGSRLVFASLGAGRVVAGGAAAGIVVDFWALRKAGLDRDEAGVRLLAFNTLLFGVFGAVAWVAALVLALGGGGGARLHLTVPWLVGVPALAAALLGLRPPRRRLRLPGGPGRWLTRILADAQAGVVLVRSLVAHPRRNAAPLVASLLYWSGDAACLWAGLLAFGGSAPVTALVLAYATGYLSTLLPLPFGGIGGVDAALTLALGAFGVPLAEALLGVLAYRAVNFWLPTVPGLAALSTLDGLGRRLERQARRPHATEAHGLR